MKQLKKLILLSIFIVISACDSDDNTLLLTVNFNHFWNNTPIISADFNQSKFTNTHGEILSISKLKYLVSNINLHTSKGKTVRLKDYILINPTINKNLSFSITVPQDTYSNISFTFGFNETDNIDGTYNDLNSESWNWPQMLGGGYHFMQFEGKYKDTGTENPFAYHMGTAKKSDSVFEQNFFNIELSGFTFSSESTLNIHMNVAEWFTNPNTWNLNEYSINLMPNYDAQKMMNENGKSVFSLGEIN